MARRIPEQVTERSRSLRRESTDAERRLWRHLRDRGVQGHKFRRQHPFGAYILDFYCAERSVVIEVDGGQHFAPQAMANDSRRTHYLQQRGLRVLRFTNLEVLTETEAVLAAILTALEESSRPSPQSSPSRERKLDVIPSPCQGEG